MGIAASTGNEKGSASNPWLNPFKSPGQQTIFQYLTSTPANTVFAKGRHTRINPQLYYYIGPFGLLAEWVKEYQELANSVGTGAVNNNAAHVTASFVIGGAATYEGIKPNDPLSVADGLSAPSRSRSATNTCTSTRTPSRRPQTPTFRSEGSERGRLR